ncbi:hypothetical protein DAEQUDRAFT_391776 [Daedalea quercina L-15889]|uniref:Uncharacterized protein n=1 Tax=Daedalea quercina L-15889 TaxID=1314783 RepID=A0A165NVQ4_9APHY|nr:hypothetical protein DAEQUDRAFT_391776 [Daedalea quercina L-15889]
MAHWDAIVSGASIRRVVCCARSVSRARARTHVVATLPGDSEVGADVQYRCTCADMMCGPGPRGRQRPAVNLTAISSVHRPRAPNVNSGRTAHMYIQALVLALHARSQPAGEGPSLGNATWTSTPVSAAALRQPGIDSLLAAAACRLQRVPLDTAGQCNCVF